MFCSLSVLNGHKGVRRPECEADNYRPLVLLIGMRGATAPFFTSSLCGAYSARSLIGVFRHFGVNCSSALTMEETDSLELSAPSTQLCDVISHHHNVSRISSMCLVYLQLVFLSSPKH
jgi:hypothetical protein